MDDVNSLHYDESPKAKFLRYIIWGGVGIFVVSVTIISLVEGFNDTGQQGFAFLGIACFLFTLTTFFLQFKITQGDLGDSARIPVFLQLAFSIFFGIAILITVYSDWHPPELNCYYDSPGTFVRSKGSPSCWEPPQCFQSSTMCMMHITSGGLGDICVSNRPHTNTTNQWVTYTCQYTYKPPTPPPTPPTPPPSPSAPPGPAQPAKVNTNHQNRKSVNNFNAFQAAEQYDNDNKQNDLLQYLYSYYSQYIGDGDNNEE